MISARKATQGDSEGRPGGRCWGRGPARGGGWRGMAGLLPRLTAKHTRGRTVQATRTVRTHSGASEQPGMKAKSTKITKTQFKYNDMLPHQSSTEKMKLTCSFQRGFCPNVHPVPTSGVNHSNVIVPSHKTTFLPVFRAWPACTGSDGLAGFRQRPQQEAVCGGQEDTARLWWL